MGWLWACLGGGTNIQGAKSSKTLRGKFSNQLHDLRLQPLPAHLPGHGIGVHEASHLQEVPIKGKAGDAGNLEAFKIPTTSVNTCISINTLKKASERSLESSFRGEFGLSMRSDVDELKEELAALRRRLANEEAEAKKLREEVSYLRSCGVLQRPEDSPDMHIYESVPEKELRNDSVDDHANDNQQQLNDEIAPVRQLRKCFSGPLLFDSQPVSTEESTIDCSESAAMAPHPTQTRISSHRIGLSPKPHSFVSRTQLGEADGASHTNHSGDEGVVSNPRVSKVSLTSGLHQYPSTKVAAWTSQITEESHHEGTRDLVILDSMDVHWIEVANAPCPSGFSTNVRNDDHDSQDQAESPRRPKLRALLAEDTSAKASQKLVGKRRPKRSVDFNEPTEKRSKEQSLASVESNQAPTLSPEQIEEQLSQAVAAFRQQKRELEANHQSFCQGPTMTAQQQQKQQPAANYPGVVGFFRNSRKKSHAIRNRGFQRSLSPVKEALSIEEVTWSRQSSSRNDSRSEDSSDLIENGGSRLAKFKASTGTQGFKFSAKIVEESSPSPVKTLPEETRLQGNNAPDERPSAMENIAMVPIQCASPSLSPKKKSAPSSLDALCALAMSSKTSTESRYHLGLEDSVEGFLQEADWIQACEWDDDVAGMDMKPIECASPSFSDRRKNTPRGPVRQSISFDNNKESSPLMASCGEFLEESFVSCGKSTSPPGGTAAFKSPASRGTVTPSPRKPWTPSPRKDVEHSPMINERSWYCDAIDAIQSINDIRRSKEGRLLTESVSLGNSPSGKLQRPPHAFSAEKKILRRAFSWYVSEHDERMRTFGLKSRHESEEPEEDHGAPKPSVPNRVQFGECQQRIETIFGRQGGPNPTKGMVLHARRFSDSDSSNSTTFSIDFNRADSNSRNNSQSHSQNGSSQNDDGALDARESTGASLLRERVDKENLVARISQASSKNILRSSDQSISSTDSLKHLRHSHEAIPEHRPILSSMPFNNWDKNVRASREKSPTDVFNADTRGERCPATTLQRALPKVSSRGIPSRSMGRSRSFV